MTLDVEGDRSQSNLGKSSNSNAKVDEQRVRAAILGALLADAASMGTHHMDSSDVAKIVNAEQPEFHTPPTPQGYSSAEYPGHYETGMLSPWGEQLEFALNYCGKHKCVTAGHMAVRFQEWLTKDNKGCQTDASIQEFLTSMKQLDRSVELMGADDERAHAFARIIPVVCLYAGEVDMLERVQDAVMMTQTNPKAIRFSKAFASLLEQVLLGKSLKTAMEQLVEHTMSSTSHFSVDDDSDIGDACLTALMEAKSKETAVQLMEETLKPDAETLGGDSARFPAAFIIPMFLLYKAIADNNGEISEESYIKAIRGNIMAGGDSCCRAIALGAILAAAAGSVPKSFVKQFMPQESLKKVDEALAGIIESIG